VLSGSIFIMGMQDERASRPASFNYLTLRPLHAYTHPQSIDALDDWELLRTRLAATPEDAVIRGLFPSEIIRLVPEVTSPRKRYVPFSNYPMREYLDLILQAARLKYPNMTAGNAVLRLGTHVYTSFANSLAGMAIFSIAQLDFRRSVELSPKAYEVTLKPGKVNLIHLGPLSAKIELRNVWAFPDIFHAGVWLGGMAAYKVAGSIGITRHSLCDVDFEMQWSSREF
jgi:uncharacterized protein (TIGR02265 family)